MTSNPQGGPAAGACVLTAERAIKGKNQTTMDKEDHSAARPEIQEFSVVDKMHEGDGSGMILLEIGFRGVRLNGS